MALAHSGKANKHETHVHPGSRTDLCCEEGQHVSLNRSQSVQSLRVVHVGCLQFTLSERKKKEKEKKKEKSLGRSVETTTTTKSSLTGSVDVKHHGYLQKTNKQTNKTTTQKPTKQQQQQKQKANKQTSKQQQKNNSNNNNKENN